MAGIKISALLPAARRTATVARSRSLPLLARRLQHDCPYTLLGVSRGANSAEIKQAYLAKARQHHPDIACKSSPAGDGKTFARISEAFQLLSDPARRAEIERDPVEDARQASATAIALVNAGHEMEAMEVLLATAATRHHPTGSQAASAALHACANSTLSMQRVAQVRACQLWDALLAAAVGGVGTVDARACNAFFSIALRASDFKAAKTAFKYAEAHGLEQSVAMKSYLRQARRYAETLKAKAK